MVSFVVEDRTLGHWVLDSEVGWIVGSMVSTKDPMISAIHFRKGRDGHRACRSQDGWAVDHYGLMAKTTAEDNAKQSQPARHKAASAKTKLKQLIRMGTNRKVTRRGEPSPDELLQQVRARLEAKRAAEASSASTKKPKRARRDRKPTTKLTDQQTHCDTTEDVEHVVNPKDTADDEGRAREVAPKSIVPDLAKENELQVPSHANDNVEQEPEREPDNARAGGSSNQATTDVEGEQAVVREEQSAVDDAGEAARQEAKDDAGNAARHEAKDDADNVARHDAESRGTKTSEGADDDAKTDHGDKPGAAASEPPAETTASDNRASTEGVQAPACDSASAPGVSASKAIELPSSEDEQPVGRPEDVFVDSSDAVDYEESSPEPPSPDARESRRQTLSITEYRASRSQSQQASNDGRANQTSSEQATAPVASEVIAAPSSSQPSTPRSAPGVPATPDSRAACEHRNLDPLQTMPPPESWPLVSSASTLMAQALVSAADYYSTFVEWRRRARTVFRGAVHPIPIVLEPGETPEEYERKLATSIRLSRNLTTQRGQRINFAEARARDHHGGVPPRPNRYAPADSRRAGPGRPPPGQSPVPRSPGRHRNRAIARGTRDHGLGALGSGGSPPRGNAGGPQNRPGVQGPPADNDARQAPVQLQHQLSLLAESMASALRRIEALTRRPTSDRRASR